MTYFAIKKNIWQLLLLIFLCPITKVKSQTGIIQNHKYLIDNRAVSISGKINNYSPNDKNGFITFTTSTVAGKSKDTSIYIHKDGTFTLKLLQSFEGDFTLSYADKYLTLYYIPGTRFNINIDAARWNNAKKITSAITLSGKASPESIMLAGFVDEYNKAKFPSVIWADSNKSDIEVSLERIALLNEEKSFLNNYVKHNKIKDKKFITWAKNYVTYRAGIDITFENFTSLRKKSMTIPQLMNVLHTIDINNYQALNNSNYYTFLHQLQGAFQIIVNINPLYKDSVKINGMNPIPVYTKYIDQYSNDITRQLMYFDLYPMVYKAGYDYIFDDAITDAGLKEEFSLLKKRINSSFTPYDVINKLRISLLDSIQKKRLIHIFESKLDSFLFVDFWGTWCAPCMRELPFYPSLIKSFEKDSIKFLLIAAYSEERKVQEIKEKLKIEAEFIVLSDNDIKALNNIFKFNSYPSHFLISPKGTVIKNIDQRIFVGDNLNQNLVDKIKSMLAK